MSICSAWFADALIRNCTCWMVLASIAVSGVSSWAMNRRPPSTPSLPRAMTNGFWLFWLVQRTLAVRLIDTDHSPLFDTRVPPDAGPPIPTLVCHAGWARSVVGFGVGVAAAMFDGQASAFAS